MPDIIIKEVKNKSDLLKFIKFPIELYKSCPYYVPHLTIERKEFFNPRKNPFFNHAETAFFLAYKNKKIVGRIAAIIDHNFIQFHGEQTGYFGFIDFVNDIEVIRKLFENTLNYLKSKNIKKVIGPFNFSTNHEIGILLDSFNLPPVIMMTYNYEYYPHLIESCGFKKEKDVLAYKMEVEDFPERAKKAYNLLKNRLNITLRSVNIKKFYEELELIKEIYNNAWEKNWGFVPMTDEEFDFMAKNLKNIIIPDLCIIAEYNNKPVGFSLALPDINQILIKLNGKLFPFGIFKFITGFKKIDFARVITLGIVKEFRNRGLDYLLYYKTFENGFKHGFYKGELSWILEDNKPMNLALQKMGASVYKTYRIYSKYI
ncbi:N-acetyltransferase [Deferribacter abyssi]|uniref:N-acetyltransferase n=1 Tax=Deferribacter abyssi TaxID=213806 RepID=UPI003C231FA9